MCGIFASETVVCDDTWELVKQCNMCTLIPLDVLTTCYYTVDYGVALIDLPHNVGCTLPSWVIIDILGHLHSLLLVCSSNHKACSACAIVFMWLTITSC